jgi:hypothetical protein
MVTELGYLSFNSRFGGLLLSDQGHLKRHKCGDGNVADFVAGERKNRFVGAQ